MRIATFAALILTSQAIAQTCAQAPNDACASATVLSTPDLPFTMTDLLGCQNDLVDRPYFDVFFRYDCTTTAEHRISACGTTGDSYMRIYADACSFLQSTYWVEDDDSCGELDPMITLTLDAGHSYWIELGAWRPDLHFPPNANDPYTLTIGLMHECDVDLAPPVGVLNFNDVLVYLTAFAAMDPAADLADPPGVFNFNDVIAYLSLFAAGCP